LRFRYDDGTAEEAKMGAGWLPTTYIELLSPNTFEKESDLI
jgi:hypothetical protein